MEGLVGFCTSGIPIALLGIKAKEAATVLNLQVRAMKGYRYPETLIPSAFGVARTPGPHVSNYKRPCLFTSVGHLNITCMCHNEEICRSTALALVLANFLEGAKRSFRLCGPFTLVATHGSTRAARDSA